jgi:hypothetical protein
VSFLVVAQSSSEVPEGLMNNPVFRLARGPTQLSVQWVPVFFPGDTAAGA